LAERLDASVRALRERLGARAPGATIGLVLGSGLGGFADSLEQPVRIPYHDVPHMSASGVAGHAGNFCFGKVQGVAVVCMQGRVHLYEGHPVERVVHGVRTMARLGIDKVLLTNAAGGLDPGWSGGDLMAIEDHINLTGVSPLGGPNDESLGPRFTDMSRAYDPQLGAMLRSAAAEAGATLRAGVYAGVLGPQYETPAEIRMLRTLGAHAVGMSTVHEVIALRHMGVRVAGLSCITNLAAGLTDRALDHAEVQETAVRRGELLSAVCRGWIARAART
jgi:purine-nucleoside phosphorylase